MRGVWQGFLPALVTAGPSAVAHGRKTLRLRALRESLRRPLQLARAHANARRPSCFFSSQQAAAAAATSRVRGMCQTIRPQGVADEALRVVGGLLGGHGDDDDIRGRGVVGVLVVIDFHAAFFAGSCDGCHGALM